MYLAGSRDCHQEVPMTASRYSSSKPDSWTKPRALLDPVQRYMTHGPIQPMEGKPRSFLSLFRWH
jgi:hypothetical protein